MFKCGNEHHKCISISNVYDDQLDCLYYDDEMFCELKSVQCLLSCHCLIYAITCIDLPYNILQHNFSGPYLSVSFFKSKISSLHQFGHKLENIRFIQLPVNNLKSVCPVGYLTHIIFLDVSHNYIMEIKQTCFSATRSLKSILLNNNLIVNLKTNAFHNLHHLRFLNLSNNPFTDLPSKCFSYLQSLKVLNLDNIKFKNIRPNSFFATNVKLIKNMDYKISCVSSVHSVCTSYPPWYISCSDILPGSSVKAVYIIIAMLTISLNMFSILFHVLKLQQIMIQHFQVIVVGLNLNDSLCGIYLTVIWVSDTL